MGFNSVFKGLTLRGRTEVVCLEWEVYSAGAPYQKDLGILGSRRSSC